MSGEKAFRILVVDDEEGLLTVLSQVLSDDGFDVTEALCGEVALELFEKHPFPLVITDIVMPGMSGLELLEKIKASHPDTQVIIMTSNASLDTAVSAIRSGAYDYLFKPFEDIEVISTVAKRAIEKVRLVSENQKLVENLRKKSEELTTHRDRLQDLVDEGTAEIRESNKELQQKIRERRQVEEELISAKEVAECANRAKSEFLASMTHELRTPMNHIIGFTTLVLDKTCGDLNEKQDEYLHDVFESSKHLLSLINDILDLSKAEVGKQDLTLTDVDLGMVLKRCLAMFKEKAQKDGIVLSLDLEGVPETIRADARRLKQILFNLLSNAMKFTPRGGSVRVSAEWKHPLAQHDECVELSVSDTGIGLNPEDFDRIFERFVQVDSSTKRKYQGTGLGLALTRVLVEMHGGRIWVESEGLGKGSSFRFIVPVSDRRTG